MQTNQGRVIVWIIKRQEKANPSQSLYLLWKYIPEENVLISRLVETIIKPFRWARNISRLLLSAPKDPTMESPPSSRSKTIRACYTNTHSKQTFLVCLHLLSQMQSDETSSQLCSHCGAKVSGRCLKILLGSIWDGSVWTGGGWNASGTTTLTAGNAKLTLILLFRTTPMIHLAKKLSLCWIFRNYFREFKKEMQFLLIQICRSSLRARHVVCCRLETESVYQSNESEPWFRSQCLNEKTSLELTYETLTHILKMCTSGDWWRILEVPGQRPPPYMGWQVLTSFGNENTRARTSICIYWLAF